MSMQYGSTGFRAIFERIFAGVVFTATAAFVVGGAIAMALQGTPLAG